MSTEHVAVSTVPVKLQGPIGPTVTPDAAIVIVPVGVITPAGEVSVTVTVHLDC